MIIYVIVILIILGALYIRCSNKIESFSGFNIINNGNFNNGKDASGVISKESNFSITNMANPSDSSYVLKQTKFNSKGYNINAGVANNTFYYLSVWYSHDSTYDGNDNTVELYGGDQKLSNKGKIIEERQVDDYKWKKIIYIVNSSNYTNLTIKLGASSIFNKGFRLFSDIIFRKYLPELPDYEYQNDLELLCIIDNTSYNTTVKSKTGKNNIIFGNKIISADNTVSLLNNSATISAADVLLGSTFSIIFSYHGGNNDNGSIFKATAVNDLNSGVNIELQYGLGVDNYLVLTVGGTKYIYQLGLVNKMATFCITYDSKQPQMYIDNIELQPKSTVNLVEKRKRGTCPDGWKYIGKNICQPLNQNKGSLSHSKLLNTSTISAAKWSKKNEINWTNCKKLSSNEIAPVGKQTCIVNVDLNFTNKPVEINSNKSLKGRLQSFIIYRRNITVGEISGINAYLLQKIHNLSNAVAPILQRPSLMKNTSLVNKLQAPGDNICPFTDTSICQAAVCGDINWDTINTIPLKCKQAVNKYCANNTSNKMCNKLRRKKCKKADPVNFKKSRTEARTEALTSSNAKTTQGFNYYTIN